MLYSHEDALNFCRSHRTHVATVAKTVDEVRVGSLFAMI